MSIKFQYIVQPELGPGVEVDLEKVKYPHHGRYLDDYSVGDVYVHPRGITTDSYMAKQYALNFQMTNPIYLNNQFARAHGYETAPLCPVHAFNIIMSQGVQNDSEKVIANLGYYKAQFFHPVYPGDTITAFSKVVDVADRGEEQPGFVKLQTLGLNQDRKNVMQYERIILVPHRGDRPPAEPRPETTYPFPWSEDISAELPFNNGPYPKHLTSTYTYVENFEQGEIIIHANGRTVTDEHMSWSYKLGNTHPLHTDRIYSNSLSGPMSGEPIVFGGLVFAWLDGLSSRDVLENVLWEMSFTEGVHTQPTFSGDTLYAISRILHVGNRMPNLPFPVGHLVQQLIGVKNISGATAIDMYGEELFMKESAKKEKGMEKIPEKVFEVERVFLVKRKP